ncbi:MAG TPA: GNAT family N-acetyltransferase [Candidatus Polarisedimenticolaceae bacterium]|nr:GNAT family N-acetyltransferase [Candidatus Polarisedimenticolaceae bacterium]
MLQVEVVEFAQEHASQIAAITRSAYANIAEAQRPVDLSVETISTWLGPGNPAGRSTVAIATVGDRPAGCCVGMANRFRTSAGRVVTAHHIGFFFVSADAQGQGVGRAMLEQLTAHLSGIPGSFVYSFPNARSIPLFRKLGYASVLRLPTTIVPKRILPGAAGSEIPGADRSRSIIDYHGPGFLRNGEVFAWRYGVPGRYRLVEIESGQGACLAVLASHRFAGVRFTVLVDIFSANIPEDVHAVLQAVRAVRDGARLCYLTTNLLRGLLPLRASVPDALNPRPVELVLWPNALVTHDDLRAVPYFTGDWLGF